MNINVIESTVDNLQLQQDSCICFDAPTTARKTLERYSRGVSGVIIIKYDDGRTCSAKFVYSSLSDDGNIEMIIGDYSDNSFFIKQAIINYVVYKARNQGS